MSKRKVTLGSCYALGDLYDNFSDKGQLNQGASFGLDVAEKVIFDHYVAETNAMDPMDAVLMETDWPDHGGKKNYAEMLARRNRHVGVAKVMGIRMQWPDIVTHNGVSVRPLVPRLRRALVLAPRVNLPRGRYEYYEIKPDSDSGRRRGVEKLANINRVYAKGVLDLPYKPGNFYPFVAEQKIPLPVNRLFVTLIGIVLARHGIKAVRLSIKVRRHVDGLLVYKVCVEHDTDDDDQKAKAEAVSKHVMKTYLLACVGRPGNKNHLAELGAADLDGDPYPRIHCRFDVMKEFQPFTAAVEQAMSQRGLALPREEWLLCCDEAAYYHLKPPGPTVDSVWTMLRSRAELWAQYFGGKAAVADLQKHVLVRLEELGRRANMAVPGLKEFADKVLQWVAKNPGLAIALVVIPILLTGGIAAVIEGGLLAGGALAAAELSGGELVGVGVVNGIGRAIVPAALAEATAAAPVATATAAPVLTFEQVALAQLGGRALAANTNLVGSVVTGLRAAAPVVTKTAAAAGGLAVLTFSTQAYAATPPGRPPAPAEPPPTEVTQAAPTGRQELIAEFTSGVYICRALAAHRGLRDPYKGESIDINKYAQTTGPVDLMKVQEPPPPYYLRYLGRVTVT